MPKIEKVCVVMNPISGGGKAPPLINMGSTPPASGTGGFKIQTKSFEQAMKELNPDVELKVVHTERSDHAVELAEQYIKEGWLVVGAGGDGTACETVRGTLQAAANGGSDKLCGYISAGSMNFFAISAGIESPVKVAEAIRDGSSIPVALRSIEDSSGKLPNPLYSVEAIHFGIVPSAIRFMDSCRKGWKAAVLGPPKGLKIGAAYAAATPGNKNHHIHTKLTITPPKGEPYTMEGRYAWLSLNGRHPSDGSLDKDSIGWLNYITVENFPYVPRFVGVMAPDPSEMTGGFARFMEASVPFLKVEMEPLSGTESDGTWYCGHDGDVLKLNGKVTITNLTNAVNMIAPSPPVVNPAFVKKHNNPSCQKAAESNKAFGGSESTIDNGCCYYPMGGSKPCCPCCSKKGPQEVTLNVEEKYAVAPTPISQTRE